MFGPQAGERERARHGGLVAWDGKHIAAASMETHYTAMSTPLAGHTPLPTLSAGNKVAGAGSDAGDLDMTSSPSSGKNAKVRRDADGVAAELVAVPLVLVRFVVLLVGVSRFVGRRSHSRVH